MITKHNGTNHTSAVIAKRALNSVKKRAHRWIVVSVWKGKVKQRLHIISEPRTPVKLVCAWIVHKQGCALHASFIDSEVPSGKASGNTQLGNVHKVNADIAPSDSKKTCGNDSLAARHSTTISIVDGALSTGNRHQN